MCAVVAAVIISGRIVARLGRYWYLLVLGPPLLAIGSGLLYTIDQSSPSADIIGFQILSGVGIGMSTFLARRTIAESFADLMLLILLSFPHFT